MARHEDQAKPVIWDSSPRRVVGSGRLKGNLGVLAGQSLVPAEQVDGLSLADGHEPRTGIAGRAFGGPLLEGVDQRFLSELFAQAHVAYKAGQTGHQPAELQAEHRLDRGGRISSRHATDSTTGPIEASYSGPDTGRTRTSPSPRTPRKRLLHSTASLRSRHSMSAQPPTISLASANGPSTTVYSPSLRDLGPQTWGEIPPWRR